jgi:hypothetical protein
MIKYSRLLHVLVLSTFFLPFFYSGCGGPSAEEKAKQEAQLQADSIAKATSGMDSLMSFEPDTFQANIGNSEYSATVSMPIDTIAKNNEAFNYLNDDQNLSLTIIKKFPILKPLLNPEQNVFTGLGTAINLIPLMFIFGTFLSMLFLVVGFLVKFLEKTVLKTILFLEIIAALFLYNAAPFNVWGEKLWGYWVGLASIIILLLFDFYVWWQQKKNQVTRTNW